MEMEYFGFERLLNAYYIGEIYRELELIETDIIMRETDIIMRKLLEEELYKRELEEELYKRKLEEEELYKRELYGELYEEEIYRRELYKEEIYRELYTEVRETVPLELDKSPLFELDRSLLFEIDKSLLREELGKINDSSIETLKEINSPEIVYQNPTPLFSLAFNPLAGWP